MQEAAIVLFAVILFIVALRVSKSFRWTGADRGDESVPDSDRARPLRDAPNRADRPDAD